MASIVIVPYPALGDITICIRLAQTFFHSGYQVDFYSDQLVSAQHMFDWMSIYSCEDLHIEDVDKDYILLDVLSPLIQPLLDDVLRLPNCVLFTAKGFPKHIIEKREQYLPEREINDRAFCLDSGSRKTMVDWVDNYAEEVFRIRPNESIPRLKISSDSPGAEGKVLIFPTTPNPKKNYWLTGFAAIAKQLVLKGLKPEIVVMPSEVEHVRQYFPAFKVHSFNSVAELIEFVADSMAVISNDSGGGHLAAMLGIPTITISRKSSDFVWRPGYGKGKVISPKLTFKLGGGHIWRPFISRKLIVSEVVNLLSTVEA